MPAAPAASCAICIGRTHTSNNEYQTGKRYFLRGHWTRNWPDSPSGKSAKLNFALGAETYDRLFLGFICGDVIGAKVFPKALPTVGTLGSGAAGPVFRHVGTTFVEPTVAGYDPTEGATTDPYPAVPSACASANELVSVKAVASAIVVTFMRCPCYR